MVYSKWQIFSLGGGGGLMLYAKLLNKNCLKNVNKKFMQIKYQMVCVKKSTVYAKLKKIKSNKKILNSVYKIKELLKIIKKLSNRVCKVEKKMQKLHFQNIQCCMENEPK